MQMCLKVSGYIRRFLFAISAVLIAISTVFATVNAVARFVAGGFPWSEELCTYCVVLMVYLALPHLEATGDQLCITAIDLFVKGKTGQKILNYIRGLISGAALAVISWYGFQVMIKAFQRSQVTFVLQMPKGALYAIAAGCSAIAVLIWVVLMICNKGEFDQ